MLVNFDIFLFLLRLLDSYLLTFNTTNITIKVAHIETFRLIVQQ